MPTFEFEENFSVSNPIDSKVTNIEKPGSLDTLEQENEEQEEEKFEKCFEEDFFILISTDFEVTDAEKFRDLDTLKQEEFEKCNEVEEYINSIFNNAIKMEDWKYKSYNITICPNCSKTKAYFFHGLDICSGAENILLHCKICGFVIDERNTITKETLKIKKWSRKEKVYKKDEDEKKENRKKIKRGPKLTDGKIPFYSGILIKKNIQE